MAEQRLWAPWRLEYIKGEKTGECIFCTKPALGDDAKALIPHRGERCYVILNAFPYNNGHLMVAPYQHGGELEEVDVYRYLGSSRMPVQVTVRYWPKLLLCERNACSDLVVLRPSTRLR